MLQRLAATASKHRGLTPLANAASAAASASSSVLIGRKGHTAIALLHSAPAMPSRARAEAQPSVAPAASRESGAPSPKVQRAVRQIATDINPITAVAADEIASEIGNEPRQGSRRRTPRRPLRTFPTSPTNDGQPEQDPVVPAVVTATSAPAKRTRAFNAKLKAVESDASLFPPPPLSPPPSPPLSHPPPPPSKVAKRPARRAKIKAEEDLKAMQPEVAKSPKDEGGAGNDPDVKPEPGAKARPKSSAHRATHFETRTNVHGETNEVEVDDDGDPVKRNKNGKLLPKRKKDQAAFEIPEVPRRDFRLEGPPERREERKDGFRGELGYACLNTVLRWQDPPVFSSRTARIKTMDDQGPDYIKELGRLNARDMIPMILWNETNGIRFMRLSSEVFPFASHAKYGYSLRYAEKELRAAGDLAKKLGHRLTMHPGQFTQLGSPKPQVIESSIRDLDTHCEMLDLMGLDQDSVMIIHGGGTFGDRQATLERIKHVYTTRLSDNVKARLVLENDEIAYSADELLPLCKKLAIPLVFDFHHDLLRPSARPPSELLPEIEEIWRRRGIRPKYHLSEPRPGASNLRERRAHSDRCGELPPDLPADAHLMIEAKDKEQAVLELYRIYSIRPVIHESLRPPHKDIGVKTSGRKGKLGGEHLPRKARDRSKAKDGVEAPGEGTGEADEAVDADATTSKASSNKGKGKGKGKGEKEEAAAAKKNAMVLKAINKAKEVAAKAGREYKETSAEQFEEKTAAEGESDPPVKSTQGVLEDMKKEAEWVRAELRAGRQRRIFGTDEVLDDEDGGGVDCDAGARSSHTGKGKCRRRTKTKTKATRATGTKRKLDQALVGENLSGGADVSIVADGEGGQLEVSEDGESAVLRQGAPREELCANHEKIPLNIGSGKRQGGVGDSAEVSPPKRGRKSRAA
ncbi:hypothetical protein ACQY0O_005779 [Thecaphora frezii]